MKKFHASGQTFINGKEDMKWLRETHLPVLHFAYDEGAAVLYGNEDSPVQIEVYSEAEPTISDTPRQFDLLEDGTYKEWTPKG